MLINTITATCDNEICDETTSLDARRGQVFLQLDAKGWTIPVVMVDDEHGIGHTVQKTFCPEHSK